MIKYTKDILMYKVSKKVEIYNEEEKKQIAETAEKASKEELINIIYKLSELENKIRMSSQKIIIFETEIIKLCIKMDTSGIEDRISKLEKKVENGDIQIKSANTVETPKTMPKEEKRSIEIIQPQKEIKQEANIKPKEEQVTREEVKKVTLVEGTVIKEWPTVLKNLKAQGKVILYANLVNTEAVTINDMTVAIRFNNNLTEFRQKLLSQAENLNILTKEISILCGKTMQIKFENQKATKVAETKKETIKQEKEPEETIQDDDLAGLINYIEEE